MSEAARRRLVVLAIIAAFLFGYPVFEVADVIGRCCLIGALPLWIFVAWALVIALAYWVVAGEAARRNRR